MASSISGPGTTGNVVEGDYIGTNATGSAHAAATIDGVYIQNGAANNTIGGTTAGRPATSSRATPRTASTSSSGATGNVVEGDYIGVDASRHRGPGQRRQRRGDLRRRHRQHDRRDRRPAPATSSRATSATAS